MLDGQAMELPVPLLGRQAMELEALFQSDDDPDESFHGFTDEDIGLIRVEGVVEEQPQRDELARNRLKWGTMTGSEEITAAVDAIHGTITTWRPNLFEVPRSQAGKDLVAEMTRLLRLFNTKSPWEGVSINTSIIFLPMMLQKPSSKSKPSDNSRYLAKRLKLWKEGKLDAIMSEAVEIQRRLPASKVRVEEGKLRGFTRMMMAGKLKQASKLVNADNVITGTREFCRGRRSQC